MTFFNIFSQKKETEEKIKILVDHREKNSLIPAELLHHNLLVEWTHLSVADYLVRDVAIERKTISDLKSSIINKRIFAQLQEIKQYPFYLLIVEGLASQDLYADGIHENAMRGFLTTVALKYQVPMIFTQDEEDTAKYIAVLAKKQVSKEISLRPAKISRSKEQQQQFILEGFPNIGPVKAKALLKKFSSLKNTINASEEELQKILGKRTKDFKELIE